MSKGTDDSTIDIPMLPSICFREGCETSICCIVSMDVIRGLLVASYFTELMMVSLIAFRIFGSLLALFIMAVRM